MTNDKPSISDFARVTRGWVDNKMLQRWRANKEWLTPTPRIEGAKPYPHRFEHLAEAAVIAELDRYGVNQTLARQVIQRRLMDHAHDEAMALSGRNGAVRESDVSNAILTLPEFQETKPNTFWAIFLGPAEARGQSAYVVSVKPLDGSKVTISKALAGGSTTAPFAMMLDISKIIDRINAELSSKTAGEV